ncbi:penicillin-binding protein 2 [Candidatus Pelagibacter sp.]|jgi:cell division protein FtsI (penicillin-binding protein 3)|uniref:peptidoglycan D,D-transpeptidase FtsI family protein n=1 Tax=uncultured Candidatus Pelagibacter sp. TaxID=372654 RepID=UPI002370AFA5|nr:penicillin-binding protein 2 [uncultured Candidatus Pelagibacter sp.]MDC0428048.1 penicillin-binding protein 2 [Candidatus Pelagibacter sp.]MDC0465267.1 penicillin-binding protein 2 [Candidatus Pelagibacter sp.]MDC1077649.1 penicillin-binding protein 2 [Candidatus Pelagibacter sp.]
MEESRSKIIIEDYKNNFDYKKNDTNLNIEFNRVAFIFFFFFIIYLIYTIHLIHLGSRKSNVEIKDTFPTYSNKLYRADIIDIDGNYLAKTVKSIDIGIKTSDIIDKKKLLLSLNIIFPNKDFKKINKQLDTKKFFWLEKKVSEENYEKLMKLGDKSIKPEEKVLRIYPQKNLFSHIIGQIDDDNTGISGLEKSFNEALRNSKNPIKLTVDKDIQFLIRKTLIKYQEIFKSKGSAALLMDINNGNILSLISLPDFNPNERQNITDVNFINRVTKGTYELGSVFKPFTFASALNEELIKPETEFLDLPKSIRCDKHRIGEYDNKIPSDLTAEQILIRSGNIGSVRIAQLVGPEKHKSFLKKVGVLSSIDFDIDEVAPQKDYNFGKCKLATSSFGHGIATTILQLARGYAVISNGGYEVKPTLIDKKIENEKKNRLINKDVSNQVVKALRKIVSTDEGTAKFADVLNYEIGGKTGTADQPKEGSYSEAKINTFASIFPTSNPQFVFIVMLDTPQKAKDYYYKYRHQKGGWKGTLYNTAGWTSVEVAGKIIDKIGPILATKYLEIK